MDLTPRLLTGRVMHARRFPVSNRFVYSVIYVVLPLDCLFEVEGIAVNRGGVFSIDESDYGVRDGSSLLCWIGGILGSHGLGEVVRHIQFVTMPRVFGYVFNPVSFYICLDGELGLRAVLCEVHNTFGESHSYLLARPDRGPIGSGEKMEVDKVFHVSPFLDRGGRYRFCISFDAGSLGIWIDYLDDAGRVQLSTSLTGGLRSLTCGSLWRAHAFSPLLPLKVTAAIHWQALKLFGLGVRFRRKPRQEEVVISVSRNLTSVRSG